MRAQSVFSFRLGAPNHAVEPTLLAQQLPCLSLALTQFCAAPAQRLPVPYCEGHVHVHAAQLAVQRDHITLESLPVLSPQPRAELQARAAALCAEFAQEQLLFTPLVFTPLALDETIVIQALGTLNIQMVLPPAANFVGRDIAHALPRDAHARSLRQWVNAAQMSLHQSPVANCSANSLWCAPALPTDWLSTHWLSGGLSGWWDALQAWDAALDFNPLNQHSQLDLVFSDVTVSLPLKPRRAWNVMSQPLRLATLLGDIGSTLSG